MFNMAKAYLLFPDRYLLLKTTLQHSVEDFWFAGNGLDLTEIAEKHTSGAKLSLMQLRLSPG